MGTVIWTPLQPFSYRGPLTAPWVMAVDVIRDATYLRITAQGQWWVMPGRVEECGPNGKPGFPFPPDRLVLPECPPGALIGKIGGSSASFATAGSLTDAKPFAIGESCTVALPDKALGPLFVTVNSLLRPLEISDLEVTVSGATPDPVKAP